MEAHLSFYKKIACVVMCTLFTAHGAENNKPLLYSAVFIGGMVAGSKLYYWKYPSYGNFNASMDNKTPWYYSTGQRIAEGVAVAVAVSLITSYVKPSKTTEHYKIENDTAKKQHDAKQYEKDKAATEFPWRMKEAENKHLQLQLFENQVQHQENVLSEERYKQRIRDTEIYLQQFNDCLQRNPNDTNRCESFENLALTAAQLATTMNQRETERLQISSNGLGISATFS